MFLVSVWHKTPIYGHLNCRSVVMVIRGYNSVNFVLSVSLQLCTWVICVSSIDSGSRCLGCQVLDNTILFEITWVVSVELLLLAAVNLRYNLWVRLGLAVRKLVDVRELAFLHSNLKFLSISLSVFQDSICCICYFYLVIYSLLVLHCYLVSFYYF